MKHLKTPAFPKYGLLLIFIVCTSSIGQHPDTRVQKFPDSISELPHIQKLLIIESVRIRDYFTYMDSLMAVHAPDSPYPLSEHLLVHANPWILDSLVASDYDRLRMRDSFLYDQREWIVLPKGRKLIVPDSATGTRINRMLNSLRLDVNIPEYTLRIFADTVLLYNVPVRVGQNQTKYLEMNRRVTDLRTKTGKGRIIRHERNPVFYDPVDGERFYTTSRDDGTRTLMPQIPWLETEIGGVRNGQMIHPTTNTATLGKAYSNGCIGTSEAAAWIIYYHAPLDTAIDIRYDLSPEQSDGPSGPLKDIYGWGSSHAH